MYFHSYGKTVRKEFLTSHLFEGGYPYCPSLVSQKFTSAPVMRIGESGGLNNLRLQLKFI